MASTKQIAFFDNLLEEKQFPNEAPDVDTLRTQFAATDQSSASTWIEKALKLPDKGEQEIEPPPF